MDAVAWHTLTAEQAAERLNADLAVGLSDVEAARRLAQDGPNTLVRAAGRSLVGIFVQQFRSLLVALLAMAAAVAYVTGDHLEASAIAVVIVLNALIGFLTEWKAARSLSALQQQAVPTATVLRNGTEQQVPARDVVAGDILILMTGDRVPADGRLVECVRLQIEESALTGESNAVMKQVDALPDAGAVLGDRRNLAYMGTTIVDGRGQLLVTATGARTEMGRIGTLIDEALVRATPLEAKLARLGRVLLMVVLGLCTVIVVGGLLRGIELVLMLEIGISLAIAAVPEGLPAVSTMTLAIGMQRMARMGALVRRLPAVETLGSTTIICTDKTGTLTQNEMTVTALMIDDRRIAVSGAGYEPVGSFSEDGAVLDAADDPALALALRIGALCNDASITDADGTYTVLGDPTEAALIVAAAKAGLTADELGAALPRLAELPFDSVSKRMVTVHDRADGSAVAFMKGSPDAVLQACAAQLTSHGIVPLTDDARTAWLQRNRQLAGEALRVLGVACRDLPADYRPDDLAGEAVFVGLIGMRDPLRPEAKAAIATCRTAGIRTIMMTGDQQVTAMEIARQLGIDRDAAGEPMQSRHARDLDGLDGDGWQEAVAATAVFARVTPAHKLRIIEALQSRGDIVAMTGDGVNDAPALKQADIGIAMGIKGTDVAKDSADMVIVDDNFATIVRAVEQGRIIFANIERFIHFLFSCNFAEILTVFVAIMTGLPLPLLPLQILWLNMLTDIFPALALALEPTAPDTMTKPPRDPSAPLLPTPFVVRIAWEGAVLALVTLAAFLVGLDRYGDTGDGLRRAGTMAFMTLALAQVLHAFNARSQEQSIFSARLFSNAWLWGAVLVCSALQLAAVHLPALQRVLRTVPPTSADWLVIGGAALLPVLIIEVVKGVKRMRVQ